ncbi:MAG: RES family NAD+ phosphorylase [Candidatus Eremiobacteraeota bacterium]|nr:RES family NAD+ phosphorylase [Candidatus Eremiobacteraeota bacterium]
MDVYRIGYRVFAKDPLDGEGSFLYGGRWSSPGTRMAYTSTTLTLAMAEFLAHVKVDDFDIDTPPALIYVRATFPDAGVLTIDQIGATLPVGWDEVPAPAVDAALGDAWTRSGKSLALLVPSVHVPIETPERNVLINPLHRDFKRVTISVREFVYDRRLLAARGMAAGARIKGRTSSPSRRRT